MKTINLQLKSPSSGEITNYNNIQILDEEHQPNLNCHIFSYENNFEVTYYGAIDEDGKILVDCCDTVEDAWDDYKYAIRPNGILSHLNPEYIS